MRGGGGKGIESVQPDKCGRLGGGREGTTQVNPPESEENAAAIASIALVSLQFVARCLREKSALKRRARLAASLQRTVCSCETVVPAVVVVVVVVVIFLFLFFPFFVSSFFL